MIEHIIISLIFVAAMAYLINIARKSFSTKQSGCARGCGTCSTVDIKKIESGTVKQQKAAK